MTDHNNKHRVAYLGAELEPGGNAWRAMFENGDDYINTQDSAIKGPLERLIFCERVCFVSVSSISKSQTQSPIVSLRRRKENSIDSLDLISLTSTVLRLSCVEELA